MGRIKVSGYRRKGYHRKAYTRSDGTRVSACYVPPTRVSSHYRKDVGAPGKGKKKIPSPEKGELRKHGYDIHHSPRKRRKALDKAVREDGATTVYRRLLAQRNYREDTAEAYARRNNCSMAKAREATKGAKPVPESVDASRNAAWHIFNSDMQYIKKKYDVGE